MATIDDLLAALRRHAGWENQSGAIDLARQVAGLPGDEPVRRMIEGLEAADRVDLEGDAGDVADEVHRLRAAYRAGLVACGARAIPLLRPLIRAELSEPRHTVMVRVLAELGDQTITPILAAWSADTDQEHFFVRLAAIEALGLLRPPEASALLRAALTQPGTLNQGWLKRYTALALGRIGDLEALEVLLDDEDWYARLGVAEAVKGHSGERAERLRRRLKADVDPRVRDV